MKINTNYNLTFNYRQKAQTFKGFSDTDGREHFMDDYGRDTMRILEKLSDAYGKDLIYRKVNPLEYNNDLRGRLYVVPKGSTDPADAEGTPIEYTYYRPSEDKKQAFIAKLAGQIITLPDGSKGSVWAGLDEANKRKKEYGTQFNANFLRNLLQDFHTAQTKGGKFLWTGPYNQPKK